MFNETRRAAWVEIDLAGIRENYRILKEAAGGSKMIGCVKADAYGHGIVKTSWELTKEKVDFLGVATLPEAVEIRTAGILTPIILLSTTPRGNIKDLLDLNVIPIVTTLHDASLLSKVAEREYPDRTASIIIALETGMGRLGFQNTFEDLDQIRAIHALQNINILGILSHFAMSEAEDPSYSDAQVAKLAAFVGQLARNEVYPELVTMSNSAAIFNCPDARFDAVRPGIMLYGLYPGPEMDEYEIGLKPAMSVKANIVYLKEAPEGFHVSYGATFVTARPSKIATLPLGYADGIPRSLSNRGRVIVNGMYAPIIGRVCMDMFMIDVTDIPDVKEYDEVVIMGSQGDLNISANEIAALSDTISYEIICRFGLRLPKIYF